MKLSMIREVSGRTVVSLRFVIGCISYLLSSFPLMYIYQIDKTLAAVGLALATVSLIRWVALPEESRVGRWKMSIQDKDDNYFEKYKHWKITENFVVFWKRYNK